MLQEHLTDLSSMTCGNAEALLNWLFMKYILKIILI